MKKAFLFLSLISLLMLSLSGCDQNSSDPTPSCETENFFSDYESRTFRMGFTSFPYDISEESVSETYAFISENADIYAEHLDRSIPWRAWINDDALPDDFVNDIYYRLSKKIPGKKMLLSVSLLNEERADLAPDIDGTTPPYTALNDTAIVYAYTRHVAYLVSLFNPDYLVIAVEVNELKIHSEQKWNEYLSLIGAVKSFIRTLYPDLPVSESMTLHNLFLPQVENPDTFIDEITSYMNTMDFAAISFYPYMKGLYTAPDFQKAFDFLHSRVSRPIAFVETACIAEDLSLDEFGIYIEGTECGQNSYLETLLTNAQEQNYLFVIWWAYRDYDALWEKLPEEAKPIAKIWRDTGILDETGKARISRSTWDAVFRKNALP